MNTNYIFDGACETAHGAGSLTDTIINGDCLEVLAALPPESVDLIVTSPPYAGKRGNVYATLAAEKYVEWFLPVAGQLKRVLRPTGSFILNIKEGCHDGERETYVLELIIAMQKQGWWWVEEYIWCKKNCSPGKWPNRFRDAWERCLHFAKQKKFAMYQDAVMVPAAESTKLRAKHVTTKEHSRRESATGSGVGKDRSHWVGRMMAYPSNVLHLATECANQGHSAAFPLALPSWFIRLFTQPGDTVLDPFSGSGTAVLAAQSLGRHWIGIDLSAPSCVLARKRLSEAA